MINQKNTTTMTMYLLMAEFGSRVMIPLDELAYSFLGLSINTAKRKAKCGELPFPTVRFSESQKASYLVSIQDLAVYIDEKCSSAKIEWKKVNGF